MALKILVCAKQVLDAELPLAVEEQNGSLKAPALPRWQMNRYDEFAVEEAVRLKKAHPGSVADVLTVGPESAKAVLERAIGMGCDQGARIEVPEPNGLDAGALAAMMAEYASQGSYDLITCGVMSEDLMRAQTGPMLAAMLGLPFATAVVELTLEPDGRSIRLKREVEGGLRMGLRLDLPALVSVQSGINTPRYPSLSNLLRAKSQEHRLVEPGEPPAARQRTLRHGAPQKTRQGLFLQGDTAAKAEALAAILADKALI